MRLVSRHEFVPEEHERHQDRESDQPESRDLDDMEMPLAPVLLSIALVEIGQERMVRGQRAGNDKRRMKSGFGDQSLTAGGLVAGICCSDTDQRTCSSGQVAADCLNPRGRGR